MGPAFEDALENLLDEDVGRAPAVQLRSADGPWGRVQALKEPSR